MNFTTFERNTRDTSYNTNLEKEARITKVYCDYLTANNIKYTVNPTDSAMNKAGSDVTIFNGRKCEIDLKGCQSRYDNVCLSYERSYSGKSWYSTLENRITSAYVFIDELNNIYFISKAEILAHFNEYKKTTASSDKAGHFQRCILIPKYILHTLN